MDKLEETENMREALTNISEDTSDDNLRSASDLDCVSKFVIVPSIHFTPAFNNRDIGIHLQEFIGEGTVWTLKSGLSAYQITVINNLTPYLLQSR